MRTMRGICQMTLATLLALFSGVAVQSAEIEPLAEQIVLPSNRIPAVSCMLWNHGDSIASFYRQIAPGERYATLLDPVKCTASPQFPFEIRTVWLTLFTFAGANWPVKVDLEIWSVEGGIPCQGPGGLLYTESRTLDQATYSLPSLGRFTLSQSVCVEGPFFVSLRYTGQSIAPYPSVMFDSRMPADSCVNWGYGPTTDWDRWNHFWSGTIPGNLIIWVDGETNSSTCSGTPCCIGTAGNVDCDPEEQVDISDLTRMIDYLYISFRPLCCADEANTDGLAGVDISDLTALIDNLFISLRPIGQCQ